MATLAFNELMNIQMVLVKLLMIVDQNLLTSKKEHDLVVAILHVNSLMSENSHNTCCKFIIWNHSECTTTTSFLNFVKSPNNKTIP